VVPADHASAEIADDVSIAHETLSHSRVSETLCGRTYEFQIEENTDCHRTKELAGKEWGM